MGYVVILYLYLRSMPNTLEVNGLQVDSQGGVMTVQLHPPGKNYSTRAEDCRHPERRLPVQHRQLVVPGCAVIPHGNRRTRL
jgi:hypothetical protein